MNRKIKFRAYIPKEYYEDETNIEYEMCYDLAFEDYEPINDLLNNVPNLMQFTGLKDKNGVEIYEGDIVKTSETFRLMRVVWGYCSWGLVYNDTCSAPSFLSWKDIKVIGNIFENSELLK